MRGGATQVQTNPFENSDTNKRYYTYEYWLRRKFGGRCVKIPVDAGFTCPNIDGRVSVGGCIYCSQRGSGDCAEDASMSASEQIEAGRSRLSSKWSTERIIPYFQAHTNTYAPTDVIREAVESALACEGTVGLNIATRADCLEDETLEYLAEVAQRTVLTVELGLQSVHDRTAMLINRGHTYSDFLDGYNRLRRASDAIGICVHLIFGLPEEGVEDMLDSVREVAKLRPDQVKLHLLHVLRGTRLEQMYNDGEYAPMEMDEYVETVCRALTYLHKDTVIGRITGDGLQSELVAPDWSRRKVAVINNVDKMMFEKDMWQGKNFCAV